MVTAERREIAARRGPSLVAQLRRIEHDAVLEGVPVGARNRIAARLAEEATRREESTQRRGWLPLVTFAAGAALVMTVLGVGVWRGHTVAPSPARVAGAFVVEGDGCRVEAEVRPTPVVHGACRLVGAAMVVQTWDATRVRPRGTSVEVLGGKAVFEVGKVPAGAPPVAIEVSHGRIEVLGTRFSVEQTETGGHVDLFEGRIRFVDRDGEDTDVKPGRRLGWGDEASPPEPPRPEPEPDPAAAATPPSAVGPPPNPVAPHERSRHVRAPSRPDAEATAIIEEVESLRRRGQYQEAARTLRRALRNRWSRRTAEVLSYELGQILSRHLDDTVAACEHWSRHRARFREGRYDAAVERALHDCEPGG